VVPIGSPNVVGMHLAHDNRYGTSMLDCPYGCSISIGKSHKQWESHGLGFCVPHQQRSRVVKQQFATAIERTHSIATTNVNHARGQPAQT
jgi:hypothetical protein